MRISSKIAVSISIVVVTVGVVATFVALERQAAERQAEHRETSIAALELLGLAVAPAIAEGSHHRAQEVLDNVANFPERFPSVRGIEVLDRQGRVVADLDPRRYNTQLEDQALATDLALEQPEARENGSELLVVVPLRVTHPLGVMRATLSQESLLLSIGRQQRGAAILLLITMLLVGVALDFMHRRLVGRRLGRLVEVASRLRGGNMSVRAQTESEDEIGELGGAFNNMARAIQAYTEDLEHIIEERTAELGQANKRLEQLAVTDELTGLSNRRRFDEFARHAIEVAQRNQRPLSLVLIDTDRFKSINDRFGHPAGDQILKDVARTLERAARSADVCARIGGEEFAVLMPEATVEMAAQAAERMRRALEAAAHPDVPELVNEPVTASFGVASLSERRYRLEDLYAAADEAMYESKGAGRNCVTVCTSRGDTGKFTAKHLLESEESAR